MGSSEVKPHGAESQGPSHGSIRRPLSKSRYHSKGRGPGLATGNGARKCCLLSVLSSCCFRRTPRWWVVLSVLVGFVMIQQIISVRNVRGHLGLENQQSSNATPLRPPPPVPSPMERIVSREQYLALRKGGGDGPPLGGAGGELTDAAVGELVRTGLQSPKQVSMERNKYDTAVQHDRIIATHDQDKTTPRLAVPHWCSTIPSTTFSTAVSTTADRTTRRNTTPVAHHSTASSQAPLDWELYPQRRLLKNCFSDDRVNLQYPTAVRIQISG